MGYSASKGVRDHRLALAQHEARAKTWQNFQRDVDSIVRTHSRGPMAETSSPELQEQLAGRYSQYRRSQQKLDVSYRRSGGRGSVQVRDRSGAGPSVKRRTMHARARSDAAAHLYAHAAFNGSTDTIDEDVHTFHSTRDVPPPPPDYDDDDVPPPPPDGHPPAHSRAVSSGAPNGRRRSSQLRHSQSLGGQMRHHHHNSDDFTNGGGRRKLDPAMSARIRPHAVVRTQTSPGRGPQSPGGTMFSPSSVSTGGGDADDGFQRLIMPPLPPRQIAATGTSVTVQWVCTEATARCFELQFRPRARKEWRSISNRITDRTYVLRNLPPGRGFYLRVRCMSDRGWSSFSVTSRVIRPQRQAPMQPSEPIITDIRTDSVTVTWAPPESNGARITLYTLLMGTQVVDNGGSVLGEDITMVYSGPDNWYRARHLQPKTTYTFRVIASNSFGDSDVSAHATCVTKTPEVVAPLRTIGDWSEWWDEGEARSYFVNSVTDERSWSLPAEFNTLLRRFGEWAEYWDETSQHCFYYNLMTQEQSWEPPAFMVDDDTGEVTVTTVDLSGTTHAGTGNGVGGAVDDGAPVKGAGIGASANSVDDNGAGASGAGAGAGAGAGNALASTGRSSRRLPVVTKTTKDTKEDIKFRSRRYQLLWNARKLGTRPGCITISVRRDAVVLDSFLALGRFSCDDMQNRLRIQFLGEKGVDSGGLHKDWCLLLSRRLSAPAAGMFVTSDTGFLDVDPAFAAHPRAPEAYRLVGRFVSKAMFDRQLVDLPLSRALVMRLLSRVPTLDDLKETDEQLVSGLTWVLNNDITGVLDSTFTTVGHPPVKDAVMEAVLGPPQGEGSDDEGDDEEGEGSGASGTGNPGDGGSGDGNPTAGDAAVRKVRRLSRRASVAPSDERPMVALVAGGDIKEVTNDNKAEYVRLMVDWRSGTGYQACLEALKEGLFEMLDQDILNTFTVDEFRSMLNGNPDVDVELMRPTTQYTGGLSADDDMVKWFWEVFADESPADRALILKFCTGTSRVPLDGFEPLFTLTFFKDGREDGLPNSHTCFNQLHLPPYKSKAMLREKLLLAARESDGFLLE